MFVVAVPGPAILEPCTSSSNCADVTLESLEAFDPACVGVPSCDSKFRSAACSLQRWPVMLLPEAAPEY